MGNDGGDIPKRKQLVKQRQKVERPNQESVAIGRYAFQQQHRSRFCNLTHQKLKQPLAIDRLGYIYNYENIIDSLLKKNLPQKYAYIKKLSDIKKVIIERASTDSLNFIACPITKLEYNGFNKFVGIWTCGHVLSRKAFKEINTNSKTCMVCDTAYDDKDVIDMNLEGQQLEMIRKYLIQKKKKSSKQTEAKKVQEEKQEMGKPEKKLKLDVHVNSIDRLGGQFRDVLREREKFKEIFTKSTEEEWKSNTYTVGKKP